MEPRRRPLPQQQFRRAGEGFQVDLAAAAAVAVFETRPGAEPRLVDRTARRAQVAAETFGMPRSRQRFRRDGLDVAADRFGRAASVELGSPAWRARVCQY